MANADESQIAHQACAELLRNHPGPLVVPHLVITEVVQLLGSRAGPEREVRFLTNLDEGVLFAEPVDAADWLRIAELVWRYQDMPMGTVDASVVAAAERLGVSEVATLDHRHFSVVRPRHVDALTLLP